MFSFRNEVKKDMNVLSKIGYDNLTVEIEFPIDDDELDRILRENYMPTDTTKLFYVRTIDYPNVLSVLSKSEVNLDQLNYLAKRLDCLDDDEMDQFVVAVDYENIGSLRDLINLSFNLDKFTLIKDISDMTKVGREYILNTEGSVPADSKYDEHYAQVGMDLLNSGRGVFTPKGLLFREDKPLEELYDGQVFPYFAYNESIVDIEIEYNGKSEMVFLPDSELAFGKALKRLGAPDLEACECSLELTNARYSKLVDSFNEVFEKDGINELNSILKTLDEYDIDPNKVAALLEYTGATSSSDINVLIDSADDFELITEIDEGDYDEVGRYFINHSDDYDLSEELEDFFNFDQFGEYIADEHSGQFVSGGFIYYTGYTGLDEILDQLDTADNSMRMGGM